MAVKAAGGGGGKGFRVALTEEELEGAFEGASREGEKFFSDPTVYLERYLHDPRHVEVQVLADRHGNVIHLGERDCSIQRRHQKVIEESPAPEWVVDAEMRERIGKIGVEAARAVDYVGAGTIEGLLSARPDGKEPEYFFLEMNTRVQVEHCVTELTTGIDIVKEGIRAAAGEPLSYAQEDIVLRGHAIECRINAEDASKNFAPAPGKIGRYREPTGPGVRVDSGVGEGGEVSPMYDPMVAKLIVWDADREQATQTDAAGARRIRDRGSAHADPLPPSAAGDRAVGARGDLQGSAGGPRLAEDAGVREAAKRPSGRLRRAGAGEGRAVLHGGGVGQALRRKGGRPPLRRAWPRGRRRAERVGRGRRAPSPPPRGAEVGGSRGSGHPALPPAGQHVEGAGQTGRHRARRASCCASSRR